MKLKLFKNFISINHILLFIIPGIILISSFLLDEAKGTYPVNIFYDPDYVYLINSLNVAQLKGVAHVDHPGTSVQIIGGTVIFLKYHLSDQKEGMINSVLNNPDEYIRTINKVLIFFLCAAIFFLGLTVYKFSHKIYLGLFLQTSCFVSKFIIFRINIRNTICT